LIFRRYNFIYIHTNIFIKARILPFSLRNFPGILKIFRHACCFNKCRLSENFFNRQEYDG